MHTLPYKAQLYLWVLWGIALLAIPAALVLSPPALTDLPVLSLGIILFILADFFEVHFNNRDGNTVIMTLADVPTIFFLAILGVPGVLIILIGSLLTDLLHRRRWYRGLFNAIERSLTYIILFIIARSLSLPDSFIFQDLRGVFTLITIAAVFYIANTVLVSTMVAFATQKPLLQVYHNSFRMVHWVHLITLPFGAILSIVWQVEPWMVLPAFLPLIMTQRSFQAVAGWQVESQRSTDLATQAQHLSQRLERLQGVTTAMMTARTSQSILQTVSSQLAMLLEASAAWVVFGQQATPHIAYLHNVPDTVKIEGARYYALLDKSEVRQILRPQLHQLEPTYLESWQSLILIPLIHAGRVHGVVCLAIEHGTTLEVSECRVLLAFAAQAALMVEHSRLFEELQNKQVELVRSSKLASLGTFSAGIAHEFNNLMAGILGYAELAEISPDTDEQAYALNIIKQSCIRGRSITRGLLTFARRDTAVHELHDVTNTVIDTLALIERDFAKNGILIERQFFPVSETLCAPGQISQVVLNLLTNARDAIGEQPSGMIMIEVSQRQQNIIIAVSDTGCGIPEHLLDQVFQPFTTTKGAFGGGKAPGTGLGLAICYGIIEEHHGTIMITTAVGQGTTVTINLPVIEHPVAKIAEPSVQPPFSLSILLVEDDQDVATALARTLIASGQSVAIAHNGIEALSHLTRDTYDVICCDVLMPAMNGAAFMHTLRARNIATPVLVITGEPSSPLIGQMRELSIIGVLHKPFTVEELLTMLAQIPTLFQTVLQTRYR